MTSGRDDNRRPEVLAPAGDPGCLKAALAAGAGAVYLGMARFNARGRAERFRGVTLGACVRAAHDHGARVYVTLNTLLHDDELEPGFDLAREALGLGVDAAIVQDAGFASLLRERLPELALHGSTQMTVHQPDQAAEAVVRLGLRRVILARECTLEEARRISDRIRPLGAEAEVFVHGALCFAYSGQCLMSNFAGRRSANRGICAQNCRFDFTAGPASPADESRARGFVGIPVRPAFDPRSATQLISMKDLAAFETVAALADAGVGSFKIEGRLKGPEYVAECVRLYRAALDAWEAGRPFDAGEAGRAAGRVYSRGFTNGYLADRMDPSMRGDKRSLEGEPDAIVLSANRTSGSLLLDPRPPHTVRAGQGYRYVHDRYRGGFRVLSVKDAGGGSVLARVRFGSEASGRRHRRGAPGRRRPPPPLPVGLACYMNDDPEIARGVESLLAQIEIDASRGDVSLDIEASGSAGEPLHVEGRTPDGRKASVLGSRPLEEARGRALTQAILEEHLGRLGGTPYRLGKLDASRLSTGVFASLPELHEIRRRLVGELERAARGGGTAPVRRARREETAPGLATRVGACVSSPGAHAAAARAGADRIVIEMGSFLEDPAAWEGILGSREAWFRMPAITHDPSRDEEAIAVIAAAFPRGGILAGHFGQMALAARAGLHVSADIFLNATNSLTLEVLRSFGASRAALSLELDAGEAARLAGLSPPGLEAEVVVGGEVFSMLTRQPFGLSAGERFLAVSEHGHGYRFESSEEGITTLFEERELVGAAALPILAGKVHAVRLDLAHQSPLAVEEIVGAYRAGMERLLAGGPSPVPEIVEGVRAVHIRHAPRGDFAGHLIRGSRTLDPSGN